MKKWKLGKLAVATGIAAMALAFSGVTQIAGVGSIPQKVYAAPSEFTIESGTTVDDKVVQGVGTYKYTGTGEITIVGYEGSSSVIDLPNVLKAAKNNGLADNTTIVGIGKWSTGYSAFEMNKSINEIILPDTLTTIGEAAFRNSTLSKIELPASLKSIEKEAFFKTAISTITIPKGCTQIGGNTTVTGGSGYSDGAFSQSSLVSVVFEGERTDSIDIMGGAFYGCKSLNNVVLPNDVSIDASGNSVIKHSVFRGCEALSSITLPSNCGAVNGYAFAGCKALKNIALPNSCATIGEYAFENSGLTEITIPDKVKTIERNTFRLTNLTKVTIPNSVTAIEAKAFNTKTSSLTLVDFEIGDNDPTIADDSFNLNDKKTYIFYCEPDDTNAIAYAKSNGILYQRHTESMVFNEDSKHKTEYDYKDKLDYQTGIILDMKYKADETSTVVLDQESEDESIRAAAKEMLTNCIVTGYDGTEKPGFYEKKITISYGGATLSYDITVYYNLEDENNYITAKLNPTDNNNTFTGKGVKPTVSLKNNYEPNVTDDCYTVTYENNINAGEDVATAVITGNKEKFYRGSINIPFTINKASLADESVKAAIQMTFSEDDEAKLVYDSLEKTPIPVFNYIVEDADNEEASNENEEATDESDEPSDESGEGEEAADNGYLLVAGTDYLDGEDLEYSNNIDASENGAGITVKAGENGNFKDSATFYFGIAKMSLEEVTVEDIEDQVYTGIGVEPEVELSFKQTDTGDARKLVKDTDYTLKYSDNIKASVVDEEASENSTYAKVVITAVSDGNYTGEVERTFVITPVELEKDMISIRDQIYTGDNITLDKDDVILKIGENVLYAGDYELTFDEESYDNNVDAGKASVTVTVTGSVTGTVENVSFDILPISLKDAKISTIDTQKADGTEQKPEVTVTVKVNGEDVVVPADAYDVEYTDNINVGTATVTVTAKKDENGEYSGNYCDFVSTTFIMKGLSFDSKGSGDDNVTFDILLDADKAVYNGTEIKPAVTVKKISKVVAQEAESNTGAETVEIILKEDTDYTVKLDKKAVDAGAYIVTVSGTGIYEGSRELTYTIAAKDISSAKLAAIAEQKWTGKAITPDVNVTLDGKTLTKDIDYETTYSNNVNEGTAGVTVTGTGNYTGTVKGSFTIKKAAEPTTAEAKATEAPAAEAATVTEAPTTTEEPDVDDPVEAPSKTKIKKLTNKASKKLVVSWKKLGDADGYEVSIATKKNFKKGKKVKNTSKASYTFTKLKKGTTYYVRVRAYNVDNGTKVYGKYSAIKKIKIKK